MTQQRCALAYYLLRRVLIIKGKNNPRVNVKTDLIKFDRIFVECGIETENRAQRKDYRSFCYDVLKNWEIQGFITSFTIVKKRSSEYGVVIET